MSGFVLRFRQSNLMPRFRQRKLRVKVRQKELTLTFGLEDNPEIDRAIERSRVNGFGYVRQRSLTHIPGSALTYVHSEPPSESWTRSCRPPNQLNNTVKEPKSVCSVFFALSSEKDAGGA